MDAGIWFVYALVDPRDHEAKYVGCTVNPQRRLWQHLSESKRDTYVRKDNAKVAWLRELAAMDMSPILVIVDRCSEGNCKDKELKWIKHFEEVSSRLLNTQFNPDVSTKRKTHGTPTYKRIQMARA